MISYRAWYLLRVWVEEGTILCPCSLMQNWGGDNPFPLSASANSLMQSLVSTLIGFLTCNRSCNDRVKRFYFVLLGLCQRDAFCFLNPADYFYDISHIEFPLGLIVFIFHLYAK